jgi:hypothetical protein
MIRPLFYVPVLAFSLQVMAQAPAVRNDQPVPKKVNGQQAAVPDPLSTKDGLGPDDLIAARATPYRPTLVRDPFASPTDADQSNKGDLVDDIAVKGRVVANGKVQAVISDSRGNVRTIGPGYRFRDGELVSVEEKAATFHQWDASGSNMRIYRTVVKTFKREEGKR